MKVLKIFLIIIIIVCITWFFIDLINSFQKKENKSDNLMIEECEDRNWVKGQSKICKYEDKNYILNDNDKNIITKRLNGLNLFNNSSIKLNKYSILRIDYDNKDYDTFGTITLFIESSFEELKELLITTNKEKQSSGESNTIITFVDEIGSIEFYKDNSDKYRLLLSSRLPYRYKINEISNYPEFIQYFLNLNEKNHNKAKK